jgi:beta-galactosidase
MRFSLSLLAGLLLVIAGSPAAAQVRHEYLLTTDWKFTKGDPPTAAQPTFDDTRWQTVRLPHDWAIYGPFDEANDRQTVQITQNNEQQATTKTGRTGGLPFVGVGWYRRQLALPDFTPGQRATLLFDGAMSDARVFVNGQEVGRWPYGYNSFFFDITSFLRADGANTLAVRLENRPEASRWYPGAGLYRNVHLIVTSDVHIPVWGTYLTTPDITAARALVTLKTTVATPGGAVQPLRLQTELRNAAGQVVATATTDLTTTDEGQIEQRFVVKQPVLWSPETPVLYVAVSQLFAGEVLKDEYRTSFGIRSFRFENGQCILNGQARKLKGVCNHHDLGPLGAAVNTAALRRQLTLLKGMGADALRTTHNMPAPELVRLCDEVGMLLMVESFDEWKTPKIKNGYHLLFDEWAEKDILNMVHRDRNHPAVVMWSIGNEVPDQWAPGGNRLARRLQDLVHREDPTRPVTAGMDQLDGAIQTGFAAVLDVPGFNYKPHRYAEVYPKLPQGGLLGSETASTVSSRGVYKFPAVLAKEKQYPDNQSSSYDLEACSWSQTPDEEFVQQDDLPYVAGEFVWTGFDYLGEPTPYDGKWPSRSSYFGIFDLAGLPKDRYYLYRARWNPVQPTVHLLPHWTWPSREGQVTPVFCYTSYPSAELFVNGKSQGRQTKTTTGTPQARYRLMWNNVKYIPGTLKVVAYDAQGKAVGEDVVRTAGKPHQLRLIADRSRLTADDEDLAFVTVRVEDAQGNLCPDAATSLSFNVSGDGHFRAAANGDATSLELFHEPHMQAFHGELVVVVQATAQAGRAELTVTAPGLKRGKLTIETGKSVGE